MRITGKIFSVLALTLMSSAPALAEGPKVYAYKGHANYCPTGLQPITISGVICCGVPNQKQSYQEVLRHPTSHKVRHTSYRSDANCPEGAKGCY